MEKYSFICCMVHLQSVQVFMYMHKMILLLFWQTENPPKKTLELIQATALDKKENEDAKKNMEKELIQSGLRPAFLGFAFCAKGEDIPLIPF